MRVLSIERGGGRQRIVTYLSDDELAQLGGLPPQAVVGGLADDDSLQVNAVFREFLHEVVGRVAPLDPDLQQAAAASGEGRIVYIDSRVPEDVEPVPDEDIIGWFRVRGGRIVEGSYLANPHHRIQGEYGFTAVVGGVREALLAELVARNGR